VARGVDEVEDLLGTGRDEAARRGVSVWSRVHPWALVELFVLSGFAIAQPLLDVIGRSPEFFLFRRADRLDILALVLGVTLLPALGVWAGEVLIGLANELLRRLVHLAAVMGLLTLLAIQVAKKLTELRGPVLVAIALAGGLLVAGLYARASWPRLWLRYLAPAPLVFALVFLLVSPTSRLVLPARAEAPTGQVPVAATGKQPPLVMILFDEFPLSSLLDHTGRIDRRVYPNFARLADASTWYRNATGVAGYTPWAMPAMLSGNYPAKMKAPSYTEYPDNMLTLFGRYYDLKVYETISQLCPPSRCRSTAGYLDQGGLGAIVADSARVYKQIIQPHDAVFDHAFFVENTGPREVSAPRRKEAAAAEFGFDRLGLNQPLRFNDFLAGLEDTRRPTLHFLHLLLPHKPWRYQPSGNEYNFKSLDLAFKRGQTPAPLVELAHQQHLLQVAYLDGLVGQVINKLEAKGLWDRSLVVLGADHGEGWVPGEHPRVLGQANGPDLMWVPQFIKAPGQAKGRVDDRNWEQVDLLPTIADLVDITVPWRMDGASQTGRPTRQRREKWWYDVPGRRKVRDGPSNWRVVLAGETDTLARAGEGVRGLYRYGPFADLAYRAPASVGAITGDQEATATLDDAKLYEQIRPASGRVPALVSGKLASPLPPAASTVLVAVNGRIGGGSRLFPERPGEPAVNFAVITPDFLWRAGDGRHQLQLYLVVQGDRLQLQPVALADG
jgi:Sulfatase